MNDDLASRPCRPCRGEVPAVAPEEQNRLRQQLHADWRVLDGRRLQRTFRFPDFATALAFVNRVGAEAEAAEHHPDIELAWGRVGITMWTHTIDGLSENDFILAARFDRLHARP